MPALQLLLKHASTFYKFLLINTLAAGQGLNRALLHPQCTLVFLSRLLTSIKRQNLSNWHQDTRAKETAGGAHVKCVLLLIGNADPLMAFPSFLINLT